MNSQDSLTDQLVRVIRLAEQHGEYDAADWIKARMIVDEPRHEIDWSIIPKPWLAI